MINPSYQQLAAHYHTAIVPARPYKPKDKAKAEVAVQIVERWIMARLRHQSFFTLFSLNQAIRFLLEDLNQRAFKKLPGSRPASSNSWINPPCVHCLPSLTSTPRSSRPASISITTSSMTSTTTRFLTIW